MENFLKTFLDKGIAYSSEKLPITVGDNADSSVIRFLQKIIFKHDVVVDLKDILNAVCSAQPFNVSNNVIKSLIERLIVLLLSNENIKTKVNIFRYVFLSFVPYCKEDEGVGVVQFFVLLSHLLGMNSIPEATKDSKSLVDEENFKTGFGVDIPPVSDVSFSIFKELLIDLSKTPIHLNSSELQIYFKWLQQLMKNIAYSRPFLNIFLEIFLSSGDVEFKLLEGNLEHIFNNILILESPLDEGFTEAYGSFLERTLNICSKFQRSVKCVIKFLSSIKNTPTVLDKEIILTPNAINEFSKIVATTSNQHSLSLFDVLLGNLKDSFNLILENPSGSEWTLLFVTSGLLVGFLKEVKLFAPSIASVTLLAFIEKLGAFRKALVEFGSFLFSNKSFLLKNESVVETFLELCFYCGEIEILINCYKDSILSTSDSDSSWECCLTSEQWTKLVNFVIKSKLTNCDSILFQLALQKLRAGKLGNDFSSSKDSTPKILMHELESNDFDIIQHLPPENLSILMDELTNEQTKSFTGRLLKQALKRENAVAWLSHPSVQENSPFVTSIFLEILRETKSALENVSWLSDECFDDESVISKEVLERLPGEINLLFKNLKKIKKSFAKHPERRESLAKVVKVFKLLPLPYMSNHFQKLGLSFAVGTGVLLSSDETTAQLAFETIFNFLTSDTDASTCFDVGLCLRWLSELWYEDKTLENLRVSVIESLVRNCPKMQFGLEQIGEMIDSPDVLQNASPLKRLESRVVLYNELGKCWQRGKKRKAENDLIGSYRTKLAKIISVEAKDLENDEINPGNCKMLLKIFAIELNKAIKSNEESEIRSLAEQKLPSYFDFALKKLKKNFDESSATFLAIVLQSMVQLRKFLPEDSLLKIWKALKSHEKVNWRLFCTQSNDEEFGEILADLLQISKKFLISEPGKHSSNCFEIWISFFEFCPEAKRNSCQLRLQEFFRFIHDCDLRLRDLPIRKKIFLVKFLSFCVTKKEVAVTSDILDTIIHVMLKTLDDSSPLDDFHDLFVAEVNVASAILIKQFAWSKSKVHLTYIIFKRLLSSLTTKCNAGEEMSKEDVFKLLNCGLSLEKLVSVIIKKEKDFARTSAYFITSLISSITSVTVIPAIKIHLTNCINNFLSISDSHTVAYLMRVLKPGYQQVFSTLYNQFKKYHKYTGKI